MLYVYLVETMENRFENTSKHSIQIDIQPGVCMANKRRIKHNRLL